MRDHYMQDRKVRDQYAAVENSWSENSTPENAELDKCLDSLIIDLQGYWLVFDPCHMKTDSN